ncbi:hypothetical protein OAL40_00430 [bacterium]|nr:hypothetical protein [bacterium]
MSERKLIKILWIEDQPEENASFSRDCAMEGFDLLNVRTADKGIELLKENPESFGGVILDALGYKETTDEAVKTAGLHHALREIRAISPDIPKVVFTGQEKFVDDDDFQEIIDVPVFYKHADNQPLYVELSRQIRDRPNAEIRRRYGDICDLCDDDFLPKNKWSETLLPALIEVKNGNNNPDRFNGLRKVFEAVLKSLCSNEILPEVFNEGRLNFGYCLRFMLGLSVTPHKQQILHYYPNAPLIGDTDQAKYQLVHVLLSVESHHQDADDARQSSSDLPCAVYTLLSLLPSLKKLFRTAPNWKTIDTSLPSYEIPGTVIKKGKFFELSPLINIKGTIRMGYLADERRLDKGDKVWVTCHTDENGYHEPTDCRAML